MGLAPEPTVDEKLTGTSREKEFAAAVRATPPGMAFTIGSGPAGKTCHQCAFWDHARIPNISP